MKMKIREIDYGVGDDLHVAFITFLSFIEIDN